MQKIGGYIIVAHRVVCGWSEPQVTHAFKDLGAAEKYVEARKDEIAASYFDEGSATGEFHPTLHAVSPTLFERVQERLSRQQNDAGVDHLAVAITRQVVPSYRVGGVEVLCTKGEAGGAVASRPAAHNVSFRDILSSAVITSSRRGPGS
jgi:hypothetical protein